MNDYIVVGKIGATYGIKGWVKIQSFTETITNILGFNPWYIEKGKEWQVIEVENGREHGKTIVVKFKKIDTPEQARLLTEKKNRDHPSSVAHPQKKMNITGETSKDSR